MSASMTTRAKSLAASSLLLGAAVIAALSMAVTRTQSPTIGERGPVLVVPLLSPPTLPPPAPIRAPVEAPLGVSIEAPFLPAAVSTPDAANSLEISAPSAGPVSITAPTWLRQPRDLAGYYPSRALLRGVEGRVVLECLIDVAGALDCRVVAEAPSNWGFGDAARRISQDYRMVPATRGGVPVEGRYTMVVPFEID